jgi:hypothetical protein
MNTPSPRDKRSLASRSAVRSTGFCKSSFGPASSPPTGAASAGNRRGPGRRLRPHRPAPALQQQTAPAALPGRRRQRLTASGHLQIAPLQRLTTSGHLQTAPLQGLAGPFHGRAASQAGATAPMEGETRRGRDETALLQRATTLRAGETALMDAGTALSVGETRLSGGATSLFVIATALAGAARSGFGARTTSPWFGRPSTTSLALERNELFDLLRFLAVDCVPQVPILLKTQPEIG